MRSKDQENNSRIDGYNDELSEFDFVVKYVAGAKYKLAYALSRPFSRNSLGQTEGDQLLFFADYRSRPC